MPYYLYRTTDHAGDCGNMSLSISKGGEVEHAARPRVGVQMRVGSIAARTYEAQDWWQTTFIEEILVDQEDYVKFRTGNSEYEWSQK